MSTQIASRTRAEIQYPDSDGQPMADNTVQFRWIVRLQGGLDALFRDDPNVFVAGDLLWYPVEGNNTLRAAPDVMVVFGRPKGDRGSYRQWEEGDVAPQVVFEILSPGNRPAETIRKFRFYERFGVEEFYLFDPDTQLLEGWFREGGSLTEIEQVDGWTSPRLGVRFDLSRGELQVLRPDGRPLATYVELAAQAEQERQRAEQERQRNERLVAQLRAAGIEPAS
ncbi:MAG: Uma2 family endonuclease [Candidatus Anammoximicrobium sp.]|nr:Uma2 family endonuclease [Candidatus Anammoximicrobium sp.]